MEDEDISPTRLGNSIRALESYAFERYGLDSQSVWYELEAVVPTDVVRTINITKANVDFFVCSLYLSGILGLSCFLAAWAPRHRAVSGALVTDISPGLLILGGFFLLTIPLWYQAAVVAIDDWAYSVQAMVNLGRKPLAQAMGLVLPRTIDEERRMWRRVNWFVRGQLEDEQESALDPYRVVGGQGGGRRGLWYALRRASTDDDNKAEDM